MSGSARHLPWLAMAVLLASCGGKPEAPSAQSAEPAAGVETAAQAPAPASVAAVAVGATTLPLAIRFEIPVAPVVGQPAQLTLTLTADAALERVEIGSSSTTLSIHEGTASQTVEGLAPGEPVQLELQFTPASAGLADVELDVRVQAEQGPRQARYAIPVLVVEPEADVAGD